MEKVKMVLVGFKRGKAKESGNPYVQLFIQIPTVKSQYGETNLRMVWCPVEQIDENWASYVGKEVDLDYGFNDYGSPRLNKVIVK